MARPRRETSDGKLFCPGRPTTHAPKRIALEHWRRRLRETPHGSVWEYETICKACEVHDRTEAKAQDPARAKIERAAAEVVTKVNNHFKTIGSERRIGRDFVMTRLHYEHLIEPMRFAMDSHRCWASCGEPFKNERDIQLEHREPPRSPLDWERMDARNIDVKCGTCNNMKADKPYSQWLHEQWEMYEQHYEQSAATPSSVRLWNRVRESDWRTPSENDIPIF